MNTALDIIIKTCDQSLAANPARIIASYSHIIPAVLALALGIFVFIKARFNFFSKVFLAFIFVFTLWLIGDVIAWTSSNYTLVYTTWSFLDYLEIVFYVLGLYFAIVYVKKADASVWTKIGLFILTLPALYITVTKQSVLGFNQPVCEAFNNDFLGNYKLAFEALILAIILFYAVNPFFKKLSWKEIKPELVVLGSMFFFLSVFGVTEYLASVTGYYEMNLYSLFLLPVFLVAIIYSVFELDIFNFHILGTHYLVVGLVVIMSGQLFFITNTTNRVLTILAICFAGILSIILFRNLKKESDQRVYIEKLNLQLEELVKQRESLMHLINHKVKGSFTHSKYVFAGILDGTFGEVSEEIKRRSEQGLEANDNGIKTIDLVLNAANMQKGIVKYDLKKIDLKSVMQQILSEKKPIIEKKGLRLESEIKDGEYFILGDAFWIKEALSNLLENSVKYTRSGKINVGLEIHDAKVLFSVKDTGIGLSPEDKAILFTEGGRGKDSVKINTDSTGYGLYSVKSIIEAHKGRTWAESAGPGKGSEFYIELPATS